ncbi:MAG: Fur family transcriptional regulator [Planctomycetia bacterium]|nr:Fur family transcriptional regulator [Planctomycetia bacterium]
MPKRDPFFQTFRKRCNSLGLAATRQRFLVYQCLSHSYDHPTADMVYERVLVDSPHISRMSVYRILESFAFHRMIRKVNHPGSAAHFDAFLTPHHHIICVECGVVVDVPLEAFAITLRPEQIPAGINIESTTGDFQGLCSACAQKREASGVSVRQAE